MLSVCLSTCVCFAALGSKDLHKRYLMTRPEVFCRSLAVLNICKCKKCNVVCAERNNNNNNNKSVTWENKVIAKIKMCINL